MATANVSEYLTIGSVIIGTPACLCQNLYVLLSSRHRGADRLIPAAAGVVPYSRQLGDVTHQLELIFFGDYDSDGVATADPHQGLRDNIAEVAAIAEPVTTGSGTRMVVWSRPNATTVSADCHVGPLSVVAGSYAQARATLDLHVPAGEFT